MHDARDRHRRPLQRRHHTVLALDLVRRLQQLSRWLLAQYQLVARRHITQQKSRIRLPPGKLLHRHPASTKTNLACKVARKARLVEPVGLAHRTQFTSRFAHRVSSAGALWYWAACIRRLRGESIVYRD